MRLSCDQRRQAVSDFMLIYGQGVYHALLDILNDDLGTAREELESASDIQIIYKAQGKCQALRHLISTISPK